MSELQCVARLKIHDGKLDEFKRLAAKCAELVRTKDTGTLQYELYFNSDNTECLVFERYRDSQALLDHHKNLGDTMAAILQTCSGPGEICGTPSPELIEQLKDSYIGQRIRRKWDHLRNVAIKNPWVHRQKQRGRRVWHARLNGRLRPANQPLFQQNLPHPDIRADDFSRVSESGARINKPGKTAEPALKIPSAFQNPLTQTPDRHWYTHP